jgi:hypothetical protein
MEQKGKGGREGEGRRQPRLGTSGKLLDLGARTNEGEEGGNKRPTPLPSPGRRGLLGCDAREKTREPYNKYDVTFKIINKLKLINYISNLIIILKDTPHLKTNLIKL